MPEAEIVATGLRFPEGPVWCGPERGTVAAGSIVCTSVADGALERVDLESGQVHRVATVGGGANAAWPITDGGFLVTQNGGKLSGIWGTGGIGGIGGICPTWSTALTAPPAAAWTKGSTPRHRR